MVGERAPRAPARTPAGSGAAADSGAAAGRHGARTSAAACAASCRSPRTSSTDRPRRADRCAASSRRAGSLGSSAPAALDSPQSAPIARSGPAARRASGRASSTSGGSPISRPGPGPEPDAAKRASPLISKAAGALGQAHGEALRLVAAPARAAGEPAMISMQPSGTAWCAIQSSARRRRRERPADLDQAAERGRGRMLAIVHRPHQTLLSHWFKTERARRRIVGRKRGEAEMKSIARWRRWPLLLLVGRAGGAASVDDLAWMSGSWETSPRASAGPRRYWVAPRGGVMLGFSRVGRGRGAARV